MPPARKRKLGGSGGQGHADEKEDEEKLLDGIWNDSSMPVRITQPEDSSSSPSTSTENQEDEERPDGVEQVVLQGGRVAGSTSHGLPSAADMFEQVREIPAYLRTEFTGVEKERNEGTSTSNKKETDLDLDLEKATNKQQKQRQGWDVSMMAPKLHSLEQQTAQQTALWSKPVNYDGESFTKASGKGTPAMSVEEFLDKGVGGAQLPRSRQERKDREKQKRTKGQSSHATWKSEAEMVLRQQYD